MSAATDRGLAGLINIIRRVMVTSKYYRLSEYQVVSSDGSTIDANPTDANAGLPPIQGYPLRYGLPGCSCTPLPGTALAVAFLNPDLPTRRPVVIGAFDATVPTSTSIDADVVKIAGGANAVTPAPWAAALAADALGSLAAALASSVTVANVAAAGTQLVTDLANLPASATTKTFAT
jgi:hypothetical protein